MGRSLLNALCQVAGSNSSPLSRKSRKTKLVQTLAYCHRTFCHDLIIRLIFNAFPAAELPTIPISRDIPFQIGKLLDFVVWQTRKNLLLYFPE